MYKNFIFPIVALLTSSAICAPNQIDIVGIIPGKSTKIEVASIGTEMAEGFYFFEIGGHQVPCKTEFVNEKLDFMVCTTGTGFTSASNIEVHETWSKGFRRKFGNPTINKDETVQNNFGVKRKFSFSVWDDKVGNKLMISSMVSEFDKGTLILYSVDKVKRDSKSGKADEISPKF